MRRLCNLAHRTPVPRYAGLTSFFRAPHVDMHARRDDLSGVDIGLLGVPYDGGCSNQPGARYGPRGVRAQSVSNVRRVNQATGAAPFDSGLRIADLGDAHVSRPFELVGAHDEIEAHMTPLLAAGITPLSVGGDHSISLPLLRAFRAQRGPSAPPLGLIHVDAHCDTGDDYGGSRFHHGAPFKIAVDEGLIDPKRTVQIGIRGSLAFADVWAFSRASGMRVIGVDECFELGVRGVLAETRRVVGDAPVYLSFDIDALDPAFAPGTGTPEVGGLTTLFAQQLIRGLGATATHAPLDLVGADLVEVSPPIDVGELTSLAAANLLFEMLCVTSQAVVRRRGPQ